MDCIVVSLFPELYKPFFETSLVAKAIKEELVSARVMCLLDYARKPERVDAPVFGHGPGMVIKPDLVERAIDDVTNRFGDCYKVFFSPHGKLLDQHQLKLLHKKIKAQNKPLLLVPGRYEGMDQRVEQKYADCVLSIGEYVLMGGDIPALALLEGLLRLEPGVVGDVASVEHESFEGPFVDYPSYTKPVEWQGLSVPAVVRSGNHDALRKWRQSAAIKRTLSTHFSWLRSHVVTDEERDAVAAQIPPHYVVLMHDEVMLERERIGTSSVTSVDLHDIARSACTYGFKNYFIATPLLDQQRIIERLLQFWHGEAGYVYNPSRFAAVKAVRVVASLDDVIKKIRDAGNGEPIVVATSAKQHDHSRAITYHDQPKVWKSGRPVLIVLGTARGLAPSVIERADYLLGPVYGFSQFNHLSVRSAAAIIFDRWLGISPASSAGCDAVSQDITSMYEKNSEAVKGNHE